MSCTATDPWVRFQRNVQIDVETGCHLWVGTLFREGYGGFHVSVAGKWTLVRAHRYAWEHEHGHSVPDGLVVAHKCNVKRCVNPAHLEAQSQQANILYSYTDPQRGRRGGTRVKKFRRNPPRPVPQLSEERRLRFEEQIAPAGPGGCQLWTGLKSPAGYGRFYIGRVEYPAHRVALALKEGRSLESSEMALHSCQSRDCVAAEHLRVGTQKENVADAINAGGHSSVRQSRSKLTFEVAEVIRRRCAAGESQLSLSKEYGVSQTTIWKILRGDLWNAVAWSGVVLEPRPAADPGPEKDLGWYRASGKTDWETPRAFFDRADAHFHFETDVCATAANAKCAKFFDSAQDGLAQEWTGTCWCNPPYGRGIEHWLDKAWRSSQKGATVICLIPGNTSTRWWHDYVAGRAAHTYFVKGKIQFVGAAQGAPFSSALVVFATQHEVLSAGFVA